MQFGTSHLVRLFDVLEKNETTEKGIRRLYLESGQAAVKACEYVKEPTKKTLERISAKDQNYKYSQLRHVTMIILFEALASCDEIELLKETYQKIGKQSHVVYIKCNGKTRKIIREIGLHK